MMMTHDDELTTST